MAVSELIQFNGGLSTKTSPHLIGKNEGVICQNVDLETGTLKPLPSLSYKETITGKDIYYFNGNIIYSDDDSDSRSYAEYGGRLYWTNRDYTSYGLMKYDSTLGSVDAVAPNPLTSTEISYITIAEDATMDGFLTDGADYTYAFTIIDNDGIESTPYIHPTTVSISSNKSSMKLHISHTNMMTIQANHPDMSGINIYRTGGNNPTFNIIAENVTPDSTDVIDDGTYYILYDTIADIDVSRIELTTFDNYAPNPDMDNLIENNGTMFASYSNRVYFSRVGSPEYWNKLDYVRLDSNCTGLGKFSSFIIAFTRTSAYIISGDTRDTILIQKLPYNQGCTNKKSIVNIEGYLLWTSLNGICVYDGSSIQVITKDKLSWDEFGRLGNVVYDDFNDTETRWDDGNGFDISYATSFQDKYYGVFNNGIAIVDLSSGLKVSTIYAENVRAISVNRQDNYMYVIVEDLEATTDMKYDVYIYSNSGINMEATWKTGRISEGSTNIRKHYRRVELDGEATLVNVYVDGVLRHTATNCNNFMLPSGCIGKDIQFEISTITEVRGAKYEYSTLKP